MLTPRQVEDYLLSFAYFREPAERQYVGVSLHRLATTITMLQDRLRAEHRTEPVRLLEIGGAPYVMTVLLRHFLGADVTVLNEPSRDRGSAAANVDVLVADDGEEHRIGYVTADVETDDWPLADASFDLVVYCEVIEHLAYDPSHTLAESRRVLTSGGSLFLSTPNALNYRYLVRAAMGRGYYPPYSGFNVAARHNRLFSPAELVHLATGAGFTVDEARVLYDEDYYHPPRLRPVLRALDRRGWLTSRMDVVYLSATATGRAEHFYPDAPPQVLYEDVRAYRWYGASDPLPQGVTAGTGVHALEPWGGGVRWTAAEARLGLPPGHHGGVRLLLAAGAEGRGPVRGTVELTGPDGDVLEAVPFATEGDAPALVALASGGTDVTGGTQVVVRTDDVLVPTPGSGDERELGVLLQGVELTV